MTTPRLSVVVVAFDMARELPRTVRSLLPPYQTGVAPGEVEIIVADNGSTDPVRREWFAQGIDFVKALDVPQESKDLILGGNAARLFTLGA